MSRRLLLLSNSRDAAGNYLQHPQREIREFLGTRVASVLFVPFAGVTASYDQYAARVRAPFARMGYDLRPIHIESEPVQAVLEAQAIAIGGGNTFHLLRGLHEMGLVEPLRERAAAGVPYIGWSAGSVVACPTIKTTNDMPIVEPPSLTALGLVPFQINAHYTDFHPPAFQGETRAERIAEFIELNPGVYVVGLREGTMLRVEGDDIELLGEESAAVFLKGRDTAEVRPGDSLRFLLATD